MVVGMTVGGIHQMGTRGFRVRSYQGVVDTRVVGGADEIGKYEKTFSQ